MRFCSEYGRKFLYLANPKTGSTSIRSILDCYSEHNKLKRIGKYHEHWGAREFKKVFDELEYNWGEYFKFITIRNPWDRYVSNFFYSRPDENYLPFYHPNYTEGTAGRVTFRDWVIFHLDFESRRPHGCPSIEYFAFDSAGCKLVDEIFPVEKFSETALPLIKRRLNIDVPNSLPQKNVTKAREKYQNYYDKLTMELVKEWSQKEIEIGMYEF